jgi:hypothetical protein
MKILATISLILISAVSISAFSADNKVIVLSNLSGQASFYGWSLRHWIPTSEVWFVYTSSNGQDGMIVAMDFLPSSTGNIPFSCKISLINSNTSINRQKLISQHDLANIQVLQESTLTVKDCSDIRNLIYLASKTSRAVSVHVDDFKIGVGAMTIVPAPEK